MRRGEEDAALKFAKERLAPEGAKDPAMMRQIEEAVTLLAYEVRTRHAGARYRRVRLFSAGIECFCRTNLTYLCLMLRSACELVVERVATLAFEVWIRRVCAVEAWGISA